ncbi:hypothetical protein [Caballeronia arationis]|jgi:hypothetical protein|nr:hypothetical protein [Caballeronia arationis]
MKPPDPKSTIHHERRVRDAHQVLNIRSMRTVRRATTLRRARN